MRIVEAYVGEYASGKSECAVNRALELKIGEEVTLADLDFVEPFYTIRPIREELISQGLHVVSACMEDAVGLGETGNLMRPEMRWVLHRQGSIIMDIGYGVKGTKILNLIEGAKEDPDLKIFVVINVARPLTSSHCDIRNYVISLGTVHGLINNSHLGEDTTIEFIQEGARVVSDVAESIGVPVIATYAEERFRVQLSAFDIAGNPIKFLTRYMTQAYW